MTSYKSPVTVYSTLRVGKRLVELTDTTFKESNENVKRYIRQLGARMWYIGIRSYFFFYGNIEEKSDNIKKTAKDIESSSLIIRAAKRFPKAFSIASNIIYPFGKVGMFLYRIIKYR